MDTELDELLPNLPALAIEGAKGVGKTATASQRARSTFTVDDPEVAGLIAARPATLSEAAAPVLIDEWQRHPPVWDWVRRQVDTGAAAGSYLLTGSAVPVDVPMHSGAGRIVSIRMRPLALSERGLGEHTVSLAALMSGSRPEIVGTTEVDLDHYVEEILASGFPGIRNMSGRARRAELDGYLARIVEHDFPEQGLAIRRPATLRAWLTAYAAATSGTASYNSLLDAATGGESDKPAKTTTIAYRDVLDRLYILDPVPGWVPGRSQFARAAQGPKHHLADPALAARLLGVDADALLADGRLLGGLFESLVAQSVRTYAQGAEAVVRHFRTRDGLHEADLIVERADRRIVAVEVKLGGTADADSVKHLTWLKERLGDDLLDAVVVTTGRYAYRRDDGIAVVPAALLGP